MGIEEVKINNSINRSVHVNGLNFPDRTDYEQYMLSKGYVSSLDELYDNHQLVLKMQRHWQAQGQNGCVFGQVAASKSEEFGWEANVFSRRISELEQDSTVIPQLNSLLYQAIASPNCEALTYLFPRVTTIEDMVRLTKLMLKLDHITVDEGEYEDKAIIGLRADIGGNITSWVVGFGPFSFFTKTRQAPIAEIVIRVKPKPEEMFYKLTRKEGIAHLGDIPTNLDDKVMERLWDATYLRVRQVLQDTPRVTSSAKVTYVLPLDLWRNYHKKEHQS